MLQIDVNVWFSMCMNYHCGAETPEDREAVKCFYIEAYSRECSTQGVVVIWRYISMCRTYSVSYLPLFTKWTLLSRGKPLRRRWRSRYIYASLLALCEITNTSILNTDEQSEIENLRVNIALSNNGEQSLQLIMDPNPDQFQSVSLTEVHTSIKFHGYPSVSVCIILLPRNSRQKHNLMGRSN